MPAGTGITGVGNVGGAPENGVLWWVLSSSSILAFRRSISSSLLAIIASELATWAQLALHNSFTRLSSCATHSFSRLTSV